MKIVVGGQLRKDEIKNYLNKIAISIDVEIMTDLDAAMTLQVKQADLYLGACDTGGGGALAMAISFLGVDKAKTIATQSSKKTQNEIYKMIKYGVVAFGFVESEYKYVVESVVKALKKEGKII